MRRHRRFSNGPLWLRRVRRVECAANRGPSQCQGRGFSATHACNRPRPQLPVCNKPAERERVPPAFVVAVCVSLLWAPSAACRTATRPLARRRTFHRCSCGLMGDLARLCCSTCSRAILRRGRPLSRCRRFASGRTTPGPSIWTGSSHAEIGGTIVVEMAIARSP